MSLIINNIESSSSTINHKYLTERESFGLSFVGTYTVNISDIEFEDDATFNGFWTLAYASKNCDSSCEQAVADIKTIRTLINMDMRRIQRVLITEDGSLPMGSDENLLIARVTNKKLAAKLAEFPENSIFLIDPIGNFMLYYNSKDINIKFVLKDLKRLLKYSRIG